MKYRPSLILLGASALLASLSACHQDDGSGPATASVAAPANAGARSPSPSAQGSDGGAGGVEPAATLQPDIGDGVLEQLAAELITTCPVAAVDDARARQLCASGLADLGLLRELSADPILWGGQPAGLELGKVPTDATLTRFNPRVWRVIYLSTLMFEGPAVIESAGVYRVLRVPTRFRNGLDSGDYPYPFWHAEKKWLSYEQAKELVFLFEGKRLIAAVRSEQQDPARPHSVRQWDGAWTWNNGEEPRVTLFRALFSQANPHVAALDASYRGLAEGLRAQTCTTCHAPNNPGNQKPLDLLNYPNQSLSGRHRIVSMLERNQMPPNVGIPDDVVRLALLERAREFAQLGDQALAFEGEPQAPSAGEDKNP